MPAFMLLSDHGGSYHCKQIYITCYNCKKYFFRNDALKKA